MELIAVPSRVAKTQSFWVTVALAVFSAAEVIALLVFQQGLMSAQWYAVASGSIKAALAAIAIGVRYIQQNTALTPRQKTEIADAVYASPTKP